MQITASPIPTTARVSRIAFTALVALGWGTVFAAEPDHPGQAVFEKHCAVCHDNPQDSRARTLDTMRETYPAFIESALREGKMKAQGALLSEDELADLMDMFLGQTRQDDNWVADFM